GGPPVGSPRWSPDGSKIAFDSRLPGVASVYVVGANGGPATRLTNDASNNHLPIWSADGRWIYFGSDRSGHQDVWKMAAGGGTPIQVTQNGGDSPKRFPGDPWIYFWNNNEVWRMPESGGAAEKMINFGSDSLWTPGRDGLAIFGGPKMYFLSFRDRKPT